MTNLQQSAAAAESAIKGLTQSRLIPRLGKRLFDLFLTVPSLILLSPLLALVALLLRMRLGLPILFRQHRPGLHGRPFILLKFRTMTIACDQQGNLLPDEKRQTAFGQFLRKTSADELPELFNVLKGEMSLVGPRPLLLKYMPYYTDQERIRFQVLPGITGWAQVNGRNYLPWDERLAHDIWYVKNWSLGIDLKILGLTLARVLRRENVQTIPRLIMPDLDEERPQGKRAEPGESLSSWEMTKSSNVHTRNP
jgi:sugar transferase EpsL